MKVYRIRAFTIIELIIAMVIAAIVVTITFTTYHIVAGSYSAYHAKSVDMAELLRLDELLKKDVNWATCITGNTNGFTLKDSLRSVRYSIDEDKIVRYDLVTDTFKVKASKMILTFENVPIDVMDNEADSLRRVDEIYFDVLYGDITIPYHYYKQFSSENLLDENYAVH